MVHTRYESITTPDGAFDAYWAVPEAPDAPAVLVFQEIFGINDNIRGLADRLAERGLRRARAGHVLADRAALRAQGRVGPGRRLRDGPAAGLRPRRADITATHRAPARHAGAATGGSARSASASAARSPTCSPPPHGWTVGARRRRLLLRLRRSTACSTAPTGSSARSCSTTAPTTRTSPPSRSTRSSGRWPAPRTSRLHRYDAGHAFSNWDAPSMYDESAARTAWDRTMSFLDERLRPV